MLTTSELTYSYDRQRVLRFPDLHCGSGEHWLLLGQSGSGKTTLLHLLGGLLTASGGHIKLDDTPLSSLSGPALDRFRGQHIGIVFQKAHFIPSLTVEENLLLAQRLANLPADRLRIADLLDRLGMGHKKSSPVQRLSVGEQQRVAIARALVNKPKLILADEPTSALDDENSLRVITLLEEQARAVEATLLIVTHDNRLKNHFERRIELAHQNAPQL